MNTLILVSARHRETKRHYALYNNLSDVQMYLNKELSLLSSILDAYPEYVLINSKSFLIF